MILLIPGAIPHPIKLELGKIYMQDKNSWSEKHYKIIFMDSTLMKDLPVSINSKINLIDVGRDIWHDSNANELHHKILKKLKDLLQI